MLLVPNLIKFKPANANLGKRILKNQENSSKSYVKL